MYLYTCGIKTIGSINKKSRHLKVQGRLGVPVYNLGDTLN